MTRLPIHHFLNVREAYGAAAAPGGGRLCFLTNITGTHQLWALDEPLGWPEQLTFYPDRLMFVAHRPVGDEVVFGKDAGGNEEQLIFLISDGGGEPEQLSVCEAKHLWGGWSRDGAYCGWSHTGRNGRDFDVYLFDLATRQERLVCEGAGFTSIEAWLPGNRQVIVSQSASNLDNDLYLVDLETGKRRLLTPQQGTARFYQPWPDPTGTSCYLRTDLGRQFMGLARLDLATGALEMLEDDRWDTDGVALSEDGRYLATTKNEAGYTAVAVRDLESGGVRQIDQLAGSLAGGLRFIPGTSCFTLTRGGPNDSYDVWVTDAAGGEPVRWTRSSMAGLRRERLAVPQLIAFESFDDREIPAFYHRPPDREPPWPVVIDIHGGPESQRRPGFSGLTQYLVQEGFAVLAPNVRGSAGYGRDYLALDDVRKRMDSVADIEAAHRWLTTEGQADPRKIALYGGSYGGFMVLSSMVTYPELWAAGVDIVGIANFITFLENTADYRRYLREAEYGSLEHDREFLEDISPLTHIDRIAAPLLVIHGRNDPRVPLCEAEQVAEAVRSRGLPVELIVYDDEGHGLAKRKNRLDAYPRVAQFLRTHLDA